ncbi:hypothetical protein PTE30175_01297 [Pandoraea terrae]|uniref:Uncharacterized protein n=1 Tax=Pandoraea terrae TaxID=1537710 RepID=A0A5E4TEZ2_9BURK|nr:hypothetical protein [Pandoraea terrae]VVD85832.1 hypothetical protein PTE30175_01297 [Pandoraea terrae]
MPAINMTAVTSVAPSFLQGAGGGAIPSFAAELNRVDSRVAQLGAGAWVPAFFDRHGDCEPPYPLSQESRRALEHTSAKSRIERLAISELAGEVASQGTCDGQWPMSNTELRSVLEKRVQCHPDARAKADKNAENASDKRVPFSVNGFLKRNLPSVLVEKPGFELGTMNSLHYNLGYITAAWEGGKGRPVTVAAYLGKGAALLDRIQEMTPARQRTYFHYLRLVPMLHALANGVSGVAEWREPANQENFQHPAMGIAIDAMLKDHAAYKAGRPTQSERCDDARHESGGNGTLSSFRDFLNAFRMLGVYDFARQAPDFR